MNALMLDDFFSVLYTILFPPSFVLPLFMKHNLKKEIALSQFQRTNALTAALRPIQTPFDRDRSARGHISLRFLFEAFS